MQTKRQADTLYRVNKNARITKTERHTYPNLGWRVEKLEGEAVVKRWFATNVEEAVAVYMAYSK